ncbi:hypothetical protein [Pararhizobium arenae]|uniref:hypothetical protein n=1 Tax=Pararhizobium arenae TaxID=1856850 RepID=UPI00094B356F|nr:hypothetical protein [Pararhizobium arenae]
MTRLLSVAAVTMFIATTAFPLQVRSQECNAVGTVGTAGSAAAGDTSASTVGTAGTCLTDDGATSSIGSAGSAAASDGKVKSQTKVNENPNQLKAQSKAQAMDQGTFSKSRTKTRVKGDELESSTRTMSHLPGEKPVMDKTTKKVLLPQ